MWIQELAVPLGRSFDDTLNFLYRHENIYVMDNHLGAAWCWMDASEDGKTYNLLHIDRHYDLLHHKNSLNRSVINEGIELKDLDLQAYLNLKKTDAIGTESPLFRWDNYILNLDYIYPDFFNEKYFATHREDVKEDGFITSEVEFYELNNLEELLTSDRINGDGWIVNLDIDYFFSPIEGGKIQVLSDKFIENLIDQLFTLGPNIKAMTIALSPDCCGGWENSIRISDLICEKMGLPLRLNGSEFRNI